MGLWDILQVLQSPVVLAQDDPPPTPVVGEGEAGLESSTGDPTEVQQQWHRVCSYGGGPGMTPLFFKDPTCQEHRPLSEMVAIPLSGWEIERWENPDLTDVDRNIIRAYQVGTPTEQALKDHYVVLLTDVLNQYTGWEDDLRFAPIRRVRAFEQALDIVIGFGQGKVLLRSILVDSYDQWNQGIANVSHYQALSDNDLKTDFIQNLVQLLRSPLGSQERQDLFRLKIFLYAELARRNLDSDQIEGNLVSLILPGLRTEDHQNFLNFNDIVSTVERTDDAEAMSVLLEEISRVHTRLQSVSDHQSDEANSLYTLILSYVDFGRKMGIPLNLLERARTPLTAPTTTTPVSWASLEGSSSVTVSPAGLPQEIQDVLRQTGFDSLLRTHNQETIILSNDINEAGAEALVANMQGRSIWFEGVTLMDKQTETRHVFPWEIASTLVHEWTHGDWNRRHFDCWPDLLRTTPNERAAFVAQRNFLVALRDLPEVQTRFIPGYDRSRIQANITQVEGRVQSANQVLGYAEDDWAPHAEEYPPLSQLPRSGLTTFGELEIDLYPRVGLVP